MRWRLFRGMPPPETTPKRPFRDTAIYYGALAGCLVIVAYLTGGSVERAVVAGVLFFCVATAWSWHVWRKRMREDKERQA